MPSLKKALRSFIAQFKALPRFTRIMVYIAIASVVLLGPGLLVPTGDDLNRSEEVKAFEKNPRDWTNNEVNANEFMAALAAGDISVIGVANSKLGYVLFTRTTGERAATFVPGCSALSCAGTAFESLTQQALAANIPFVSIDIETRTAGERMGDRLRPFIPLTGLLVVLTLMLVIMHRMQNKGGDAATLTERPQTLFDDVIGNLEAKAALGRVLAFMRNPEQYEAIGARASHGVLLVGPPGTGKTLLARALAGETGATFIAIDGSYFTSMFYGAGIVKVKALFALARKHAPCVLFIDEIDGIGRRSSGEQMRGGEAEGNRIINRVLVEMDGFTERDNVIVVAATNHVENLDPALTRAGRFDTTVQMALPNLPERAKLFAHYLKDVQHGDIDTQALARLTSGVSPADVANIVNKAASKAVEDGWFEVTDAHILSAIETHQLGGEVSANRHLLSEETRQRIAVHEAGHALVGHRLRAGIVERVSIEPRGAALGVTYMTRESEDPLYGEAEMTARLAMMLAGREAELMVFGNVSSGAADDLKRATELAVQMVGTLGFSRTFGLMSVNGVPQQLLGPDVQGALLAEAGALLEQSQQRCREALDAQTLHRIAEVLLANEVVSGEALADVLGPMTEPPGSESVIRVLPAPAPAVG